jgi:hypothetical protein
MNPFLCKTYTMEMQFPKINSLYSLVMLIKISRVRFGSVGMTPILSVVSKIAKPLPMSKLMAKSNGLIFQMTNTGKFHLIMCLLILTKNVSGRDTTSISSTVTLILMKTVFAVPKIPSLIQ